MFTSLHVYDNIQIIVTVYICGKKQTNDAHRKNN